MQYGPLSNSHGNFSFPLAVSPSISYIEIVFTKTHIRFMNLQNSSRRAFLGTLGIGTAVSALGALPSIMQAATPINTALLGEAEEWLKKGIKGDHRIAYDGPEPHDAFPIIWTWAFYLTNNMTGVKDEDMTGLCVLRHNAIPFAMKDELWAKYKFGEMFSITDNTTKATAVRNPYYEPKEGDYPMPGIDGIKTMQGRGAMFCVCELAITVYSGFAAQAADLDPEAVKKDWMDGLLPGIQPVPSGVWALGRAQELGCGYIYAGG